MQPREPPIWILRVTPGKNGARSHLDTTPVERRKELALHIRELDAIGLSKRAFVIDLTDIQVNFWLGRARCKSDRLAASIPLRCAEALAAFVKIHDRPCIINVARQFQ